MIRMTQVKLPICHTDEELREKAAKLLRIRPEEIVSLSVVKQ